MTGTLPIVGNVMTLNGTIVIGTATVARGAYQNATSTNLEVGKTDYTFNWDDNKGSISYADGMLYCYEEKRGNVALVKATPDEFKLISSFKVELTLFGFIWTPHR